MKKIIIAYVLLSISLIIVGFFVGVSKVETKPILTSSSPYLYDTPSVSIKDIHLTVFYFVPKDKLGSKAENWQTFAEEHIKKLVDFHTTEFLGRSKITYSFFPEVIIGDKTTKDYEVPRDDEDPDALIPIKKEIIDKVFTKGGSLYAVEPQISSPGIRNVYLIVFEGDGGSAREDYALVGRAYLTDKLYGETGSTYLAHEFYHTLLLPDHYKKSAYVYDDGKGTTISLIIDKDIMGRVDVPLSYTYISRDTLKKMGI